MELGEALKTDKPYRALFRLGEDNPPIGSFGCTILNKSVLHERFDVLSSPSKKKDSI
jgi:hypothetical protein